MPATGPTAGIALVQGPAKGTSGFPAEVIAACAMSFVSGAAGLAHQVLWTRRLVDVLGATALTFSKVVGAFFLGLALGGWVASRFRMHRNPWLAVAAAELLTAVLALPVLWTPKVFQAGPSWLAGSAATAFVLPLIVIVPPALCMGLVLPWLARGLIRERRERAAGQAVVVYAVNILGGICGIALLLLYALPVLGTVRSGLLAIALNLAVCIGAALFSKRHSVWSESSPASAGSFSRGLPGGTAVLSFISGFLVLGGEVVLQHQFAQVTINSFFSNGTVLALVLLGLGLSALLLTVYQRMVPKECQFSLAVAAAAITFAAQPVILLAFRPGLATLPYELSGWQYALQVIGIGSVGVLPLFVAAGLIFPLILGRFLDEGGDVRLVGRLLAWNGVGGWLGAEVTQHAIAPGLGLWLSMIVLAASYALSGIVLARRRRVALAAVVLGMIAPLGYLARSLPQTAISDGERISALKVSADGVVAVSEAGPGDLRILFNNSYTLGGSTAQFNQERQGHLPLLLHGNAKSVALLGVATGSTTAGVASHSYVERIEAFELSPVVLEFAREYFAPFNRNVFEDERVRFVAEDARWGIAGRRGEYDVAIGDLFLPWRTGEGRLFTLEHFENVRRALRTNGLFCQWLPMFQLTRRQFESIARTFQTVFPEAFLIRGDFYAELPIIGLVGGRGMHEIDWKAVESVAERLRGAERKVQDGLALHAEGVAMTLIGPVPRFTAAPINTLDNGWIEWDAGRNIIGLREPWFIGVPLAEFVRDSHRLGQEVMPAYLRQAHESGQFFLTLEIAAKVEASVLENLKAQVPLRLPGAMRTNSMIEWKQWPSRIKPGE